MKPRPQRLNNFHPVHVDCQTPPRRTSNRMFRIKLDVQRIKGVAARSDRDANTVSECIRVLVFRFIELEGDMRQIVELRDGVSLNLGPDTAFKDAVE